MRGLVQRVTRASVTVDGEVVGAIGPGLCVLVGVTHSDDRRAARKLAGKLWHLRIMDDEAGVMNRSVADTTREVLVVSQFTLYGDTSGGRRPSWIKAAGPEEADRSSRPWPMSCGPSGPPSPPGGSGRRCWSSWSTTAR